VSGIRAGDLVSFIKGRSDEIEKTIFPDCLVSVYLVVSDPKMKVFTMSPGERSHETLSVEIMAGTSVHTVPVNILERTEKSKNRRSS